MAKHAVHPIGALIEQHEEALLQRWVADQLNSPGYRADRISPGEVQDQSRRFLAAMRAALRAGEPDIRGAAWQPVRELLESLSTARAEQGFSPSETATFIFSLKEALFSRIREQFGGDLEGLAAATWETNLLLDRLGLFTTEVYQRGRDALIRRQQQEMIELSTPVVTLWDSVLALPLIGTLDSARTQVVMENLLQRIVESGASIAIIDITGVPTVDTLTAQHLLKTVAAARLMGADCIISGIRPQIAQTIVHLGVDLGTVMTKATLADAFSVALRRLGLAVQKSAPPRRPRAGEAPEDQSDDRSEG
jgi:rsbT co-antagonist protein RsbR